jgi:hypothetical protein
MVIEHKDACDAYKKSEGFGTERKLHLETNLESDHPHAPHDAIKPNSTAIHNLSPKK